MLVSPVNTISVRDKFSRRLIRPNLGIKAPIAYNGRNAGGVTTGHLEKRLVAMRYLAQFSEAPRTGAVSFWADAQATEDWLAQEGKQVENRRVTIRARGVRALEPWLLFQTQPLTIDAWLDPMEATITWAYLVQFLAEIGPDRIWIPCGADSWVGWEPERLTIHAPSQSWLWTLTEEIWDPAGWEDREELEWWSDGRPQNAVKLSWGILQHRSWNTGWEEWRLSSDRTHLTPLWIKLAGQLGSRSCRVRWRQESPSSGETLLGLRCRYVTCDLTTTGERGVKWLNRLTASPEPIRVRAQAEWSIPRWTEDWATTMTLRRVQRGTRLESTYTPRRPMGPESWLSLRRDRRQVPILQIRPLILMSHEMAEWDQLEQEALSHQHQEQFLTYLKTAAWPEGDFLAPARRVRLAQGWTIKRWASQPGLWVLGYGDTLEVQVEWPTPAHPGNIAIGITGAAPLPMNSWAGISHFKRLNRDRHYWSRWIAEVLLPILERFEGGPNR